MSAELEARAELDRVLEAKRRYQELENSYRARGLEFDFGARQRFEEYGAMAADARERLQRLGYGEWAARVGSGVALEDAQMFAATVAITRGVSSPPRVVEDVIAPVGLVMPGGGYSPMWGRPRTEMEEKVSDALTEKWFGGSWGDAIKNAGDAIKTAVAGGGSILTRFTSLALNWLPWVFLGYFLVRVLRVGAGIKAGPLGIKAGAR